MTQNVINVETERKTKYKIGTQKIQMENGKEKP